MQIIVIQRFDGQISVDPPTRLSFNCFSGVGAILGWPESDGKTRTELSPLPKPDEITFYTVASVWRDCVSAKTEDQHAIDSCKSRLSIAKGLVTVALLTWIIELYGCIIVRNYVRQLREEDDVKRRNKMLASIDFNGSLKHTAIFNFKLSARELVNVLNRAGQFWLLGTAR
ncbi:hypothetical protein FB451DRAFT_1163885 [Mycena latifolia]|nr:hypothetical protein FB451DRAFT_1163885 [Mycena latifolia]